MVRMSVLATCLRSIINAEKAGKRQVLVPPYPLGSLETRLQGGRQVPQSDAEAW